MHRTNQFIILFVFVIFINEVFHMISNGRLFVDFMPKTNFDHVHSQEYHKFLIRSPRGLGSLHYNESVKMVLSELEKMKKESQTKHPEVTFDILNVNGEFSINSMTNIVEYLTYYPNIIVNITLVNQSHFDLLNGHLIFSAHIDSHSHTKGAYDDGINCAIILELIHSLVVSEKKITNNLMFIFCGSEELGLHGSRKLIEKLDLRGEVVNMESLGDFRPFGFITQTKKSSNILKYLSKSKGVLISTLFTDLYHSPIVLSFSDIDNYEKLNITGAQSVFFGNPTYYHTKMDMFSNINDIKYAGNILKELINNYKPPTTQKEDVIGFGLSPFILIFKKELHQFHVKTTILIAIITVILSKQKLTSKFIGLLRAFLSILFVIICYLVLGFILFKFNSGSYAQNTIFNFIVLCFYGLFALLFTGILEMDNETIKNSSLIFESLLLFLIYKYDISILFFFILVFKLCTRLCVWIKYLFGLFYTPMLFFISFTYYFAIGFGNSSNGYIGEIIPFICVIIFVLTFSFNIIPILNESTKKINRNFYLLPIFLIISYFTLINPPYSENYLILGIVNEDIYENGTGLLSFIPAAGKRISNGINNDYKIENITRFMKRDLAYTKKLTHIKLPSFIEFWPKYTVERINNKLHIEYNSIPRNIESSVIIIQCGNKKCINKIGNSTDIGYRKINNEYIGIVRFIPLISGFSSDIILNTKEKVNITIIFTSPDVTKENSDFTNSLSKYVYNMARERYICGTVLINNSIIL